MINIDKNKDIDGYVNKLTDIINAKIKFSIKTNSIICDINNISNMVNKNTSNIDNDTLHLIDDILNKYQLSVSLPDQLSQDI